MLHSWVSWILFPLISLHLYYKMSADVETMNFKIRMISKMPSMLFSELFKSQKACAICMNDFKLQEEKKEASRVTWLSCDTRHYFHTDCIKFWLHR